VLGENDGMPRLPDLDVLPVHSQERDQPGHAQGVRDAEEAPAIAADRLWQLRLDSELVYVWQLRLDSELVYVGDVGTTEPGRASSRRGNLAGKKGNDIEYAYASCSAGEVVAGACNGGVNDRHVHPMEPRTARVSARWTF
jgi:hypothetical protein